MTNLYLKKEDLQKFMKKEKFVVTKELYASIAIYSEDEFENVTKVLKGLPKECSSAVRFYMSVACEVDYTDHQNELPLTKALCGYMEVEEIEDCEIYIWKIGDRDRVYLSKTKESMNQLIEHRVKKGDLRETLQISTCRLVEK